MESRRRVYVHGLEGGGYSRRHGYERERQLKACMGNGNNMKANILVFFFRARTERMMSEEKWETIIMIIVKHPPFQLLSPKQKSQETIPSSVPRKIRSSSRERIKPKSSSFP